MKPKSIQSVTRLSLVALTVGVLTACGGAGGGGGVDIADGGIRGTGSSVGPVSGFGSVFVNGVRFDTDALNGQVQSDDGIGTENELDEGMILRVDGEWRNDGQGTANRLDYDDTLRGPITVVSAWDEASETAVISISGLLVNIDRQTVVKGRNVQDLADDDLVRISGWRLPSGEFRASLVRVHSGSGAVFDVDNEFELEGPVRNYTSSPCSFEIGSVQIHCDNQSIKFETVTPADLASGAFIEVEGDMVSGKLEAFEIREDDLRRYRRGNNDDIEFAGPVSEDFDGSKFLINGLVVNVTAETEFEDDLIAQELVSGLLIQVEGDFQGDGTINAEEIERREANAEVEGTIDGSVNPDVGTFSVGGVRIRVSQLTLIEDDDDAGLTVEQLLLSLNMGDEVEVEGIERETGEGIILEALKIEREEDDDDGNEEADEFQLKGKLRAIDDISITVLGVTMTAENSAFDDETRQDLAQMVDQQTGEFPVVDVEYEPAVSSQYSYQATDIELEDDD